MILTAGKRGTRRETCHSATLSTTDLTWSDLGSNTGLHGERLMTKRLSHTSLQLMTKIHHNLQFFPRSATAPSGPRSPL
jgi:hypothetical protein